MSRLSLWAWACLGLCLLLSLDADAAGLFNVLSYGALADGSTDNTAAIQAAINAAGSAGGGTVEIPAAAQSYLSGPLTLVSNLTLQIDAGATLMMLPMGRYPAAAPNFITANNLSNVTINGGGTIDGQGQAWWTAFIADSTVVRPGTMLYFAHVSNANVSNLTLQHSPKIHQQYWSCDGVLIDHQTIFEPYSAASNISPNTDGMDVASANVVISNCNISTGDDVIAIGSSSHHATNISITACTFGTGHGLSIGSHTSGLVDHIYVSYCTFNGTQYGLRLKSDRGSGGLCDQVHYSDITMTAIVYYPIFFTSYYPTLPSDPSQDPGGPATLGTGTPIWQNISFSNINATASGSKAKAPLLLWGLPESLVANVSFDHVHLNGPGNGDVYHASNVSFDCASTINGAVAGAANVSTYDATVSYLPCPAASPTPTRTRTPVASTPTASPTQTASLTRSRTATGTASPTTSATPTVANTATASRTASATLTLSASPTVTQTRSPTATASASPSASATPSASPSVTRSATASQTGSATRTPTALPASATPTASPTPSPAPPSPTRTPTLLDSPSPSPSLTAEAPSATASPTASAVPPSATPTESPAPASPSPSATASASPTASPSASPTDTATVTITASPSASPTDSPSASTSPTPSPSVTPSRTRTALPASTTPSLSPSTMPSATPTPTLTEASPSASAVVSGRGTVVIDAAQALPNPNPRQVAVHLLGDVDSVWLRAYNPALVQVWQGRSGPLPEGWNRVALDTVGWAPGFYVLSLVPQRGTVRGRPFLLKLLLQR